MARCVKWAVTAAAHTWAVLDRLERPDLDFWHGVTAKTCMLPLVPLTAAYIGCKAGARRWKGWQGWQTARTFVVSEGDKERSRQLYQKPLPD